MDEPLRIAPDRYWSTIEASARIGAGPHGGLRRLALTDADAEMRRTFAAWCRDGGYDVRIDRLGNMFAHRRGRDSSLPPVLVGSHLDSQAAGGRYDGVLGVMAGLEILRRLDDLGIETERPIEVVNWTNEEGARFTPPMMASSVFAGKNDVAWGLARSDEAGRSVADELARIGFDGTAPVGGWTPHAYFELHIEQGPRLDAAGVPAAVVTHGYVARGMRIAVRGETAHSGPTPMHERRNALVGASLAAAAVNEIGWRYAHHDAKATVARLDAWPNRPGILSSDATLTIDFRAPTAAVTDAMAEEVRAALPDCSRRAQTDIAVADAWTFGGPAFDSGLMALLHEQARRLAVPIMDLPSQAGHDAYNLSHLCPTAMVFTPCWRGMTHNEAEHTAREDQVPGANILLNAVLARARS
jgi:N-carbamoyl-L-amino-acid hydrolase